MTSFKETSCRFCLKNITDYQVVNNITRDILNGLLLKLKFRSKNQEVICNSCNKKLTAALEFKSKCLNTDNTILQHADCEEMLQVDLREIYKKENRSGHTTDISYDDKICRLCMQLIVGEIRCIGKEELEAIQKFSPKMNIMIKDPVVCTPCFDSLYIHNTFLKDCLDADQRSGDIFGTLCAKIETDASPSFIKNEAKEESKIKDELEIKTEYIDIKSEEVEGSYIPSWNLNDKHVESTSGYQSEYVQTINGSLIEDEEKRHGIKNENDELKYRETLEEQTYRNGSRAYGADEMITPEEQTYQCDSCDYKTNFKNTFKRHQLRHQNIPEEKMHKCDLCDYKAIYKHNLKQHQLKHKDISKEQMFKCDSCDYKAIYKQNLKRHQLRHKIPETEMFKCDSCDCKTIYKQNLKRHQLRHKISETEMFKCDSCDYKTIDKYNFNKHQLRHKDIPEVLMFKCNWCEYKTIDKSNLNKHQLIHKSIPEILRRT